MKIQPQSRSAAAVTSSQLSTTRGKCIDRLFRSSSPLCGSICICACMCVNNCVSSYLWGTWEGEMLVVVRDS